jgi:hypothetical protein
LNVGQVRHFILETLLKAAIEISSALDFVSDTMILLSLSKSADTMWFSFTLWTMLCPYYTVYTSLMTFLIKETRLRIEKNAYYGMTKFISCLLILPTMIIILILLDLVLMITSVLLFTVMLPFIWTQWGQHLFESFEESQNNLFIRAFGMSKMDIAGFRCQRTIL